MRSGLRQARHSSLKVLDEGGRHVRAVQLQARLHVPAVRRQQLTVQAQPVQPPGGFLPRAGRLNLRMSDAGCELSSVRR